MDGGAWRATVHGSQSRMEPLFPQRPQPPGGSLSLEGAESTSGGGGTWLLRPWTHPGGRGGGSLPLPLPALATPWGKPERVVSLEERGGR